MLTKANVRWKAIVGSGTNLLWDIVTPVSLFNHSHCKCNNVPGELSSKFPLSEKKDTFVAGYMMQTLKYIILKIIHCGNSVLRS